MEYSVNRLAKMSGVSARTLRYYDEIGLLKPVRVASSGYRIYGAREVDALQQILFFRELDFSLEDIRTMLFAPDFDRERAFLSHLKHLTQRRERLDALIQNVTHSLAAMKGETEMKDNDKFGGFAQKLVDENERLYGAEIREKYGDDAINESNAHVAKMTREQFAEAERLSLEIAEALKLAVEKGDPACESAQLACEKHARWLSIFNPRYCKEYHLSMGELYVSDERFKAHYEKIAEGGAEMLRDAIKIYCSD